MAKLTKRQKALAGKVDSNKLYPLSDALAIIKECANAKFDESIDVAVQLGIDYAASKDWGVFASIAKVQTKSKLVAAGTTVLTTEIDFRPTTYSFGVSYRF